jgi:hypothetical protein
MVVRRGRPLLGDYRVWAGLTLAACVILTVALGLLFNGQTGPDGFDNAVDSPAVAFFRGHETLLLWLAAPGTSIPAIVVSAAVAVACLITGRLNGHGPGRRAAQAPLPPDLSRPDRLPERAHGVRHSHDRDARRPAPRPAPAGRHAGGPGGPRGRGLRHHGHRGHGGHRLALALLHRHRGRGRRRHWHGLCARTPPRPWLAPVPVQAGGGGYASRQDRGRCRRNRQSFGIIQMLLSRTRARLRARRPRISASRQHACAVVKLVVEVDRRRDQRQVAERLGEVAELLARAADLF